LAKITPVAPPIVKSKIKPLIQKERGDEGKDDECKVAIHLKTFTPVGTAIIKVAAEK
jgi:hypothetical protein